MNHYLFLVSVALDETFETSKGKCDGLYSVSFGKCRHVGAFEFGDDWSVPVYRINTSKGLFSIRFFYSLLSLLVIIK